MIKQKTINLIKDKLVETYLPKKIYLFGSYAWGEPNEDSDLDLMIIVEESNEKFYKRPRIGYKALRGLGVAKDIIVYTTSEFDNKVNEISSLIYKVENEGIKLYEKF